MERLGKKTEFRDGLRVTDAETVDIARMVLVGKVNRDIVASINVHGPVAVGLSGEDAGLIVASARNPELGFVGDVAAVNPADPRAAAGRGPHPGGVHHRRATPTGRPTTSTPTPSPARWPRRSAPRRSIYLTDIEGLLADVDDPGVAHQPHHRRRAPGQASTTATLTGGMIPKIAACVHAVEHGVGSAHILDGRVPHVVLLELFSDAGIGTMITKGDVA